MSEPARTHWPAVAAAVAAGMAAAACIGKLPTTLPRLTDEFGLSLVAAGWVVSMFNVLAAAAALFFGLLADRAGALRFCFFGLAALIAGGLLGAAAHGTSLLIVSRIIEGSGFISVSVAAPALINAAVQARHKRLALGLWSTYVPAGILIAMLAAPAITAAVGWRGLWLAVAGVTLAVAAALAAMRPAFGARTVAPVRSFAAVTASLRQPAPWWCALSMGCYALQWQVVMVWLPTFLLQQRGASLAFASAATAAMVAANIPGVLFGTWLMQRNVSRGSLISIAAVSMAVCGLAIFSAATPDALRVAACVGLSFLGGLTPPAVLSSPQTYARSPAQIGSLQGLIVQMSNLGQFIGPPVVAAVVSATGHWDGSVYVLLAAAAGALASGQMVARCERAMRRA